MLQEDIDRVIREHASYDTLVLDDTFEKDAVVVVKTDMTIRVQGEVHIKQIVVQDNCNNLFITGDDLYVNNPDRNIAIGIPIVRDLSGGRYYFPEKTCTIVIDCRSIHTRSGIQNCGIGTMCIETITSNCFTNNCIVRDTPMDMVIYNEPLQASTKHFADPTYMTVDEMNMRRSADRAEIGRRLHFSKVMSNLYEEACVYCKSCNYNDLKPAMTAYSNFLNIVKSALARLNKQVYAEGIDRIYSSVIKAYYDSCSFWNSHFAESLLNAINLLCLSKEVELFSSGMPTVPLSVRYLTACSDYMFDGVKPDKISNYANLNELGLDSDIASLYHIEYTEELSKTCQRYLFGSPVWAYPTDANEILIPQYRWDENCLHTNFYSHILVADLLFLLCKPSKYERDTFPYACHILADTDNSFTTTYDVDVSSVKKDATYAAIIYNNAITDFKELFPEKC